MISAQAGDALTAATMYSNANSQNSNPACMVHTEARDVGAFAVVINTTEP